MYNNTQHHVRLCDRILVNIHIWSTDKRGWITWKQMECEGAIKFL